MSTPPPGALSIAQFLSNARSHLNRLTPIEASRLVNASDSASSAILVDIRPALQRATYGTIPHALIIERNVLEWRFDPQSDARLDLVDTHGRYDMKVIVFCQEGYTSSLAARCLQELGLSKATDINGGFKAWEEAGLPTFKGEQEG